MARRPIHHGAVIDLGIETVAMPDGRVVELEIVRHPGGAVVVALHEDDEITWLRQYRHAAGGWIHELPAGKIDAGEDPLETARRELAEEAGLEAVYWQSLGAMLPSPGFCTERLHLYLARGLSRVPTRHERAELIEIERVPFTRALEDALSGRIEDAKSVVALARAAPHVTGGGSSAAQASSPDARSG